MAGSLTGFYVPLLPEPRFREGTKSGKCGMVMVFLALVLTPKLRQWENCWLVGG